MEKEETWKMEGSTTIVRTLEEIAEQFKLAHDDRFRFWGKTVSNVNLNNKGGYALEGQFFSSGRAMVIPNGTWVVIASETGSRKHRSYEYLLVQNQNGNLVPVKSDIEAIEAIKNELPPQIYANALNNILYAYAVLIWYAQKTAP